jgi:hypothetical protein
MIPAPAVCRFEPVSDLRLLAAIERAERHIQAQGILPSRIAEHLGFRFGARTTRQLRPQIEKLIAAQALVRSHRHGCSILGLTSKGRKRLARARREGKDLELPEAPQHQTWRNAREQAEHIDQFRSELAKTLTQAQTLLQSLVGALDATATAVRPTWLVVVLPTRVGRAR